MSKVLNCSGCKIVKSDLIRGQDCYLYDTDDNEYIDFEAGVWCNSLGYNNKKVSEAIKTQIQKNIHLGYRYTNDIVETAAIKILKTHKNFQGKCVFLSSGSEAVEFGVQITRRITSKPLLITLSDSYLSAYGSAARKNEEKWYCFDWSVCKNCPHTDKCDPECDNLSQIPIEKIGGFVFEPGNTSGLVKLPPKQLISFLENMVREQQGFVIVDEVTTGVGRTGKWYGYEHYNLKPDIIAMGKGIGNGYPLSVVVMKNEIADEIEHSDFHYVQSHQNDPLGCAIASEVVAVIEQGNLIDRSNKIGISFLEQLKQLKDKHQSIREVRGRGLMIAVEFQNDDEQFSLESVFMELFKRGFIVGYKPSHNMFRFYPPLTIKEADIKNMLNNLDQILIEMI